MWIAPPVSETAMTVEPSSAMSCAAIAAGVAEALDDGGGLGQVHAEVGRAASTMVKTQPRAVASLRPSDPPRLIGLPVTTPGTV